MLKKLIPGIIILLLIASRLSALGSTLAAIDAQKKGKEPAYLADFAALQRALLSEFTSSPSRTPIEMLNLFCKVFVHLEAAHVKNDFVTKASMHAAMAHFTPTDLGYGHVSRNGFYNASIEYIRFLSQYSGWHEGYELIKNAREKVCIPWEKIAHRLFDGRDHYRELGASIRSTLKKYTNSEQDVVHWSFRESERIFLNTWLNTLKMAITTAGEDGEEWSIFPQNNPFQNRQSWLKFHQENFVLSPKSTSYLAPLLTFFDDLMLSSSRKY